jgi:hypothetical protein
MALCSGSPAVVFFAWPWGSVVFHFSGKLHDRAHRVEGVALFRLF